MAQLDYYATFDESMHMLADIFQRGDIRAYVGQGPYDEPDAAFFSGLTPDLAAQLRRIGSLYLAGSFSTHPPLFLKQTAGPNAGQYFMFDSNGGPHISLLLANVGVLDGKPTLLLGMLGSQARYQLEQGRYERASDDLKEAFADISRRMKKHMVRHRGLWVGKEALKLVQEGKVRLPEWIEAQATAKKEAPSSSTPPSLALPRAAESA